MSRNKKKASKKRKQSNNGSVNASSPEADMFKRPKFSNLLEADIKELETLFSKKLAYAKAVTPDTDTTRWIANLVLRLEDIENNSSIVWQDEDLMKLKKDVNNLKDQLSEKDIESWHSHTTECNLAGKIIPYVKSLGVELCTQAWVKFYEIVNTFSIVPDQPFISVHLCEAPGAFIAALNHHLQQKGFPHDWDWCATTLNPYHESNKLSEMIADDRLIRGTHHKWFFGRDGSGDIKAERHIEGLIEKVKQMEEQMGAEVLLVTADGSKDCQENPAEQEALLSQLHYCEMLAGCLMLSPGGCLVIKIFTMFEAPTIGLISLLNILFQRVNAFKPATSKSGNSEMYVVCEGYLATLGRDTLWRMLAAVRDSSVTCFVNEDDVSRDFLEEHRRVCHHFAEWQSDTINRNMRLYGKLTNIRRLLNQQQEYAIDLFIDRTGIEYQRSVQRLVPFSREKSAFYYEKPQSSTRPPSFIDSAGKSSSPQPGFCQYKNLKGTFHLRQNFKALSFEERIELMDIREVSLPNAALTCQCPVTDQEVAQWANWQETTALLPCSVYNSRLCEAPLLDDYNFLLKHSQFSQCRKEQRSQHIKTFTDLLNTVVDSFTLHPLTQHHFHPPQLQQQQQEQLFQPQWYQKQKQQQNHDQQHQHSTAHQSDRNDSASTLNGHRHLSFDTTSHSKPSSPFSSSLDKSHHKWPSSSPSASSPKSDSLDWHSRQPISPFNASPENHYHKWSSSPTRWNLSESYSKPNSRFSLSPEKPKPKWQFSSRFTSESPSPHLKLVWIGNGCNNNDGYYSLFQNCFSKASPQRQNHRRVSIEVEVVADVKDEDSGAWENCDVNNTIYFLNTTRLFSESVESNVNGGSGDEDEGKGHEDNGHEDNSHEDKNREGKSHEGKGHEGDGSGKVLGDVGLSSPHFHEELDTRGSCLDQIARVLQKLPVESSLVVLSSSFLTRFHVGLLYILARHFQEIQITSDPNLWLHQVVVCRGFLGVSSPALLQHLSLLTQAMEGDQGEGVVETVKFIHILSDRKFTQFVTNHNNRLLSGFINKVLEHHKDKMEGRGTQGS